MEESITNPLVFGDFFFFGSRSTCTLNTLQEYSHLIGASNDLATVTMTFVPNTCQHKQHRTSFIIDAYGHTPYK
jgi:hypothetical protein